MIKPYLLTIFALIVFVLITASVLSLSLGKMDAHNSQHRGVVDLVEMEPDAVRINSLRKDLEEWGDRASPDAQHSCTIHLKNPGREKLEEILHQVSDPKSPSYGKHLSKAEMDQITANPDGVAAMGHYLDSFGISWSQHGSNVIKANGTIANWEAALHTEFFQVKSRILRDQILLRAHHYYLPKDIAEQVVMISETVQLPVELHHGPVIMKKRPEIH